MRIIAWKDGDGQVAALVTEENKGRPCRYADATGQQSHVSEQLDYFVADNAWSPMHNTRVRLVKGRLDDRGVPLLEAEMGAHPMTFRITELRDFDVGHDVVEDRCGFGAHPRLTCRACGATLVKQPHINAAVWERAKGMFLERHPEMD